MLEPLPPLLTGPQPIETPIPLPQVLQDTLAANGGLPILLEDPQTHQQFVLRPDLSDLPIFQPENEEYLRREIRKGIDDFEAGRYSEWNLIDFKAKLRERSKDGEQSK